MRGWQISLDAKRRRKIYVIAFRRLRLVARNKHLQHIEVLHDNVNSHAGCRRRFSYHQRRRRRRHWPLYRCHHISVLVADVIVVVAATVVVGLNEIYGQ